MLGYVSIRTLQEDIMTNTVMKTLNSPLLTIATLAAFIWLAQHSYQRTDMHGNKLSDVSAFYDRQMTANEAVVYLYGENGEKL